MKKNILLVAFTLIFIISSAYGQQESGDMEFQLAGTYMTTVGTDFTISTGFIQAKVGKYFTDNLELGIAPNVSITTVEGETETTVGGGAFFVYSFLSGDAKSVPYFGAQYYKSDLSESDDIGSAGVSGGLKYYVTEKAAFDFGGNYLFDLNEGSEGGILLFTAGISFLF